jgi:S-adenosylmethionine-diacylgycerolhomoserine-N-methlytransferase
MDAVYRFQRHIYDVTRKPYLLGRDPLIRALAVPAGGRVLEIGCGTARNLLCIARRYPGAECYGVDISAAMLQTARQSIAGDGANVRVALGDAAGFDPQALFGIARFDRVVISYALSMIPAWQDALSHAASLVAPGGSLHIADFGDQREMPAFFRNALFAWLARFSVTPRLDLGSHARAIAAAHGHSCRFRQILGGYAALAEIRAPL